MNNDERLRLNVKRAAAILTTEELATDGGAGGGDPGAGGGDAGPNLAELFTAEEITARQESIATAKAEEERRAGLTDEQRAEEDRLKAEQEASGKVPEEYADFTLPEGMQLDEDLLGEFKPLAKELGLPQAQAQKVVDLGSKLVQKTLDGIMAQHQEQVTGWLKEAESDPEIGADVKLGSEKSAAVRAFNSIIQGNEKVKQMVDETGIGNHPEFLRIFYRLSKHMREDTFEITSTGGQGGLDDKLNARYPNTKN